ncbi:MAG TPA: prepilin-type N-terminal cleavage/methylation domain-containing protein [Longimicrobiales bacterium]
MSSVRRSTGGFTLVELLVVVVIGALILGATYQVLAVQERSYRQQSAVINTQQTMRDAVAVLESELREISPGGGDLLMMTPDSLRFRAYRAAGFICSFDEAGQRIAVQEVPGVMPGGNTAFRAGDSLLYFIEGLRQTGADDAWGSVLISTPPPDPNGSCGSWGGGAGTILNVPGFPFSSGAVLVGAPVRSFQVLTYGLYDVGGEPMLARHTATGSLVPVIGPLAPSGQGPVFRYFDANGNPTTNPGLVARIEIVVRGRTEGTGVPGQTHYSDSLVTQLFLRNN